MEVVLASGSPRRRELLEQLGWRLVVAPAPSEEPALDLPPIDLVEILAESKAFEVANLRDSPPTAGRLVIGADTVVECDGEIFGKPGSADRARSMLRALSGREHRVFTGLCLILDRPDARLNVSGVEETSVLLASLTEEEISRYVSTGEPLDKAGAYGIQGRASPFIERIQGDYFNVVGLPLHHLYRLVRKLGLDPLALAGW